MKSLDEKHEGPSDDNKKQTQIHMITIIICSIAILVLALIAAPSMIYAQNKTNTPSNATTVEGHATNTTGTAFNATASSLSSSPCLAKDTTIIVDVYSGMTRTMHFKANQTSNTLQGISALFY
jgi:flagellar basal body-associated protein FliL